MLKELEGMLSHESVVIGGASGFWGEATHATAQLLSVEHLDYLVYDYLAEITLSLMARARADNPQAGYASDFVRDAIAPNLQQIAASGVRVLSNAGGMNPQACAEALRQAIADAGLALRVAVVEGDDLMDSLAQLGNRPESCTEMFSGEPFPEPSAVVSANAYLGAYPLVTALNAGADIVITGRCVDSALALAACIHHFDWRADQLDQLAAGSLAGHLIECGPQATGGNFTDWHTAGDFTHIGYPVAEVFADGHCLIRKPDHTTGIVSTTSVAEQMLYEIGDPRAYVLPDVTADFSNVTFTQIAENVVSVSGAKGYSAPAKAKVSVTWHDGYRAGYLFTFNGIDADQKARQFAQTGVTRAQRKLKALGYDDFTDTSIEVSGGYQRTANAHPDYQEALLKTAVRHADAKAVQLFLKETMGAGLSAPPGLAGFTGAGRPRPSPVVRLYSCLLDCSQLQPRVTLDGSAVACELPPANINDSHDTSLAAAVQPATPAIQNGTQAMTTVALETVAVARSGDKGDTANVGVIARSPALLPWLWRALDETLIRECFGDLVQGTIHRYYLPGCHAMNIVMEQSLGGGGIVSLRNDAQGKGYAQRLLAEMISVPVDLYNEL